MKAIYLILARGNLQSVFISIMFSWYNFNILHIGLKQNNKAESGRLALYDGNEIVFQTSDYWPVTLAKMFWRYGMDIYNVQNWVRDKILAGMSR